MLMFQAYLDDSGRASGPTYIIAGFLTEASRWPLFASVWGQILEGMRLPYFKMKEAMNPRAGEKKRSMFYGWTRSEIDQLVELLTDFICDTLPLRIRIAVPNIDYAQVFKGKMARPVDFPYLLAHISAMQESTRLLAFTSLQEKVDFIFDMASEEEQHYVIQMWHFWKNNDWHERRRPMFGDPPIFRDDKTVLPLQAADLYAWHARKASAEAAEGRTYEHPGWLAISRKIAGAERDWSIGDLEKLLSNSRIIRDLAKLGPWSYEKRPRRH
jgi:hypothetical protein